MEVLEIWISLLSQQLSRKRKVYISAFSFSGFHVAEKCCGSAGVLPVCYFDLIFCFCLFFGGGSALITLWPCCPLPLSTSISLWAASFVNLYLVIWTDLCVTRSWRRACKLWRRLWTGCSESPQRGSAGSADFPISCLNDPRWLQTRNIYFHLVSKYDAIVIELWKVFHYQASDYHSGHISDAPLTLRRCIFMCLTCRRAFLTMKERLECSAAH